MGRKGGYGKTRAKESDEQRKAVASLWGEGEDSTGGVKFFLPFVSV